MQVESLALTFLNIAIINSLRLTPIRRGQSRWLLNLDG